MNENVIKIKSFQLAVRIVKLCKYLQEKQKEFILSKQILRSGTSIGANVRESQNAENKADFIHKLSIAQKETDETLYWLELLNETEYINNDEFCSIHEDTLEIMKIIRSIIISTKQKL